MSRTLFAVLLSSLLVLSQPAQVFAESMVGKVIFSTGNVWALDQNGDRKPLQKGSSLYRGHQVFTDAKSYLQLKMVDQGFLSLGPDSVVEIVEYQFDANNQSSNQVRIDLKQGTMRSITGVVGQTDKKRFRLNTPVAAIGIRGTDFSLFTSDSITQAQVSLGGIVMSAFGTGCQRSALGPCEGSGMAELYGHMADRYLELKQGQEHPELLDGQLKLLKDVEAILKPVEEHSSIQEADVDPLLAVQEGDSEIGDNLGDSADKQDELLDAHLEDTSNGVVENVVNEQLDLDTDSDGVLDSQDAFPNDPLETVDTDGDGVGDNADLDADGDSINDDIEEKGLLDPLLADTDGDGVDDAEERDRGTVAWLSDTDGDGVEDGVDQNPLRNDNYRVTANGETIEMAQESFQALQISQNSASYDEQTSMVTQQLTLIDADGNGRYQVQRHSDSEGSIFWGNVGQNSAFQNQYANVLADSTLMERQRQELEAAGMSGQDIEVWASRLSSGSQVLVSDGVQELGSSGGLEALKKPDENEENPRWNLIYKATPIDTLVVAAPVIDPDAEPVINPDISKFKFEINYQERLFLAKVDITDSAGTQSQVIRGAITDSGMIVGGNDEGYIRGFFVNGTQQVALIYTRYSDGDVLFSSTLLATKAPYSSSYRDDIYAARPVTFQSSGDAPVQWGRWSNFAKLDTDAITALKADREVVASNDYFALLRSAEDELALPNEGEYRFEIKNYEAIYQNSSGVEVASVLNPSLKVDFDRMTFGTHLEVSAPTLEQNVNINAQGQILENGTFSTTSESALSNSDVSGFLTNGAEEAGMIFKHELDTQRQVTGAVNWQKQ
ncbi:FecR domain-containing protein [Motiliproteus sp. MSK22-1]|uniref:FecR family protein n=1 Tax=Motiliproteus sp. MSK22-1 TaxID=1897630 RepID=UPI0009764820|nr:FecR domain-containing protein [Motiliproteus sp. MSK22-1]OMH30392.1 hypothetical protein BGP75_18620 [Motiliproteus sp. MSK22-1]